MKNKQIKPKNTPNKPKSSPDAFTASEVGTLINQLQSEFRIFGEKLESLETKFDNKIDGISINQARTLEKVTALEIGQKEILKKIDSLEIGQKALIKRVETIEQKISFIENRLTAIETEIKEIKSTLSEEINLKEFKILETRVSDLERKVELILSK